MEQHQSVSARSNAIAVRNGIAVTGWLIVVVEQLASFAIWSRSGFANPGYVFMLGPAPMLALYASLTAQAASALILTIRRPDNRVGWVILVFALVTASSMPVMAATAGLTSGAPPGENLRWLAWAVSWIVFPAASFLAFLLAFIFPTGRLVSPSWRPGIAAIALASGLAALGIAVRPGPLLFFPAIVNPAGLPFGADPEWLAAAAFTLLATSGILAGIALLARYRLSDAVARVQIRWYIAAGVLLAVAYVAESAAILALEATDPLGEMIETVEFLVLGVPAVAITIAILRYRLYDIDAIISRAIVYGALTAVLAGMYAAGIRLFNAIFVAATGESSDVALVITTLLLATTFTPIKRRLEGLAEQRLRQGRETRSGAPTEGATSMLDDPAFVAALDARILAALEARAPGPRRRS